MASPKALYSVFLRDLALCKLCNDYVIRAVKEHPTVLREWRWCPLAKGAVKEIERCREEGLIGVGEIFPQGQDFDITDPRETWRLAAACYEMNMFVMIHTAEPSAMITPER